MISEKCGSAVSDAASTGASASAAKPASCKDRTIVTATRSLTVVQHERTWQKLLKIRHIVTGPFLAIGTCKLEFIRCDDRAVKFTRVDLQTSLDRQS